MASISSLPHRQISYRFFRLRGQFLDAYMTTDFREGDQVHGRSMELLFEEMDAMERLIHRYNRMKEDQI